MNAKEDAPDGFIRLERDPTLPAQCVILAGGRGERMRPYTEKMPKPMFQIGGKPILCATGFISRHC